MNGFLDAKNSANSGRWRWRWHLQGGSQVIAAKPLQDLRNAEELRLWRFIEFKRRHLSKKVRKVVNLASVRIARAKRKQA